MRVSTRKGDAGYREDSSRFVVLLNGKVADYCHTADEELGEAHCYLVNEHGEPLRDRAGLRLLDTVKRGDVVIVEAQIQPDGSLKPLEPLKPDPEA